VSISKDDLGAIREGMKAIKKGRAPAPPKSKARTPFARIPLHWLPIMRRAHALTAIPLLVAIAHEMAMRERRNIDDRNRIPITEQTWLLAGAPPTEGQRRAMLQALRRIPSIVRFEYPSARALNTRSIRGYGGTRRREDRRSSENRREGSMGAREHWLSLDKGGVFLCSENDGPTFLRKGAERDREPVSITGFRIEDPWSWFYYKAAHHSGSVCVTRAEAEKWQRWSNEQT
jgi:hypothetical protein